MSERTVDQPARGGGRCSPELGQAAADKALAFAAAAPPAVFGRLGPLQRRRAAA